MKRTIIKIDENRCTGCGTCVKGCHGGALQLIDGKARLINEDYCDGLGACIGECPVGAITLEELEVNLNNEQTVKKQTTSLLEQSCACPGMQERSINASTAQSTSFSPLRQFPIQLHLVNPYASFLKEKDLVLAADCTAFVYGNFHHDFMKNKNIVIACPKLDHSTDYYVEKLTTMIDNALINTLSVIIMEVPCCRGLFQIALQAHANAKRKIPINKIIIGINGELQQHVISN